MLFKKSSIKPSSENMLQAAKNLIAIDKKENSMEQLVSMASGGTAPRDFYFSLIQLSDAAALDSFPIFSGLSRIALRNKIVHGSACLSFAVFFSGLVDPVYTRPELEGRLFVTDVLNEYGELVRVLHGKCRGAVGNIGFYGSLVPAGILPYPSVLLAQLDLVKYGGEKEFV